MGVDLLETRYITVKDKNRNLIAVFSNDSACNSDEVAVNLMIAPTINLVSNGESTLSFQMLSRSEKWQQIKNPENIYECNGREYTPLNAHSIVYSGDIVNVTLVETWYLLEKKYVQAYNVDTNIEAIDDHTVKILPKSTETLFVNGKSYSDSEVKDSRGETMPRGSAGYALWAILRDSGWSLGVCDVIDPQFSTANDWGCFNVETDMKDVLYNIEFIQEQYGGILVWDSMNKTVSLRSESVSGSDFNTWKGYSIRKGKNLQENPTITWDNDLTTRLYVLGQNNLNIKKVNDQMGYVEDHSYTDAVYVGYSQNQNIYDTTASEDDDSDKAEYEQSASVNGQKALLYWGKEQVKKYAKPRKSVSYSVVDIRGNTEAEFYEDFDINDIAKAYYVDSDTGEEVDEELRIQHLQYNYFFPSTDSTIEVGDKIANEVEIIHEIYKTQKYENVKSNALKEIATTAIKTVASSVISVILSTLAKAAWAAIQAWVKAGCPLPIALALAETYDDGASTRDSTPSYDVDSLFDYIYQATQALQENASGTTSQVQSLNSATSLMQLNASATDDDVTELLAYVNEKIGDLGTNEDGTPKTVKQYIDEKIAELSAK